MYWYPSKTAAAGGSWKCAVKVRARAREMYWRKRDERLAKVARYYERNRDKVLQAHRDVYDNNAVYRIGKNLKTNRRKRLNSLSRRKAAMVAERGVSVG